MSLAQRAILFLQVFHGRDQLFDAFGESHQLEIELCFCGVAHAQDYRAAVRRGQYNDPMIHPDYNHIQQLLAQERSLADAAEAHGTLGGCLCGAAGYRFEDWLKEILPEGAARAGAGDALRELFDATVAALRQPDMEFELLLPDDAEPIEARTAALAQWCQGFLYGLGAGTIPDMAPGIGPGMGTAAASRPGAGRVAGRETRPRSVSFFFLVSTPAMLNRATPPSSSGWNRRIVPYSPS